MKMKCLKMLSPLFISILFVAGCQKEIKDEPTKTIILSKEATRNYDAGKNECRLTIFDYYDGIADYHQIDYFSYEKGVVGEWLSSYGSLFKIQYDRHRKLKLSEVYNDGTLAYTIHFIYKRDRVVKEIWYKENTLEIDDEVVYTYNRKGEMIQSESTIYGYLVKNTYTDQGDLKSWFLYFGGLPNVKAEYTYRGYYKNPFKAIPGIEYYFPYINSALGAGKRWHSSEKYTFYDENGSSSVYYDLDPKKTAWSLGSQHYPVQVNYTDKLSDLPVTISFEFENCLGSKNFIQPESLGQKSGTVINNHKLFSANNKLLIRGPKKEVLQRLKEWRKLATVNP